jgi:hypothetical protein
MSHLHHIVPKHMGGTDDPDNLIELSVEDHAEAHKKLFEEYGHWQDYLAWQGLSKIIPREELISMVQSEAAKERLKMFGNPFSGIQTSHNFSVNEEFRKQVSILSNTPEALAKKKATWQKTGRGKAEKNSQYGTCWVNHPEYGDAKIKKELLDHYLEMGYKSGRVIKL